jgi:hypothetical protein
MDGISKCTSLEAEDSDPRLCSAGWWLVCSASARGICASIGRRGHLCFVGFSLQLREPLELGLVVGV